MTTTRTPRTRVPMCPGCGLYPHTHNWVHGPDCTAQQTTEQEVLINTAEIFGPHLTPDSATELQRLIQTQQRERRMPLNSGTPVGLLRGDAP